MELHTKSGLLIASGYSRIVRGDRGEYIEINREQININAIHIPTNCKWRTQLRWRDIVYYIEYRTKDKCNVKVYLQKHKVGYADYIPGFYYVHPNDIKEDIYKDIRP